MSLHKFIQLAFSVTVVALIYIHMQMQIITLAYQGKYKEKQIRKMVEENSYLTYLTLSLKSSSHLGGKMLAENSSMEFADPRNVVEVAMPVKKKKAAVIAKVKKQDKVNQLLSMMSLRSQAEAKQ